MRSSNLGNQTTAGAATVSLNLPEGVEVVKESGVPQVGFYSFARGIENLGPNGGGVNPSLELCKVAARQILCSTESFASGTEVIAPLRPYEFLEIRAHVKDTGAAPGATYEAESGGGGAGSISVTRQLPIGEEAPRFGAEDYALTPEAEGGATDPRAGSHPYQLTTDFNLNQNADEPGAGGSEHYARPPALARNLHFRLPPGQIARATSIPTCSATDFAAVHGNRNDCPSDTVIGVATITIEEPVGQLPPASTFPVPLFNLEPAYGEPARFGFEFAAAPVILDTAVRSGKAGTKEGDYGVTVTAANTTQLVNFISSTVTFWGTPGDPSHDQSRGWDCLVAGQLSGAGPCEAQNQAKPPAFLTLPTDCAAPFATTVEGDSWTSPATPERKFLEPFTYSLEDGAGNLQPLTACNQLPFNPQVHSEPTSNAATSPTGLSFDVNFEDEGLLSSKPDARAQSQLNKAIVTLPQGFTTNPSVAEGLKACSEAEYEAATLEANSGCTSESKIGEVEVASPLVKPSQILHGGLYVATQHQNPNGNLLTLYLIARNPEIGVVVKQALKVEPDPATGQLTTEVDSVPQLPFSHFHLSFRQGQRSPLITPPACGPYTVKALMYPWSNPGAPVERTSSFQITAGPEGNP
ncbi:MAG TPA: hypothetical protein VGO13_12785, partial [Solirubrobacterales bacterium]|nr:hypothetical protein [Solirubrobacterales bacterium]